MRPVSIPKKEALFIWVVYAIGLTLTEELGEDCSLSSNRMTKMGEFIYREACVSSWICLPHSSVFTVLLGGLLPIQGGCSQRQTALSSSSLGIGFRHLKLLSVYIAPLESPPPTLLGTKSSTEQNKPLLSFSSPLLCGLVWSFGAVQCCNAGTLVTVMSYQVKHLAVASLALVNGTYTDKLSLWPLFSSV